MASPEVTPERLSSTLKSDGSSSRSGTPDSDCSICLGKVNNKAFTDACFHTFCFVCLLEWSKIKATCPLCKTTFKSIIHNVVSNDVYDQYHLKPTDNGSFGSDRRGRRFRYSTTMTEEHRSELTWRRNRALRRRYQSSYQIHIQAASEERRRLIYRANLWARHMGSNPYTLYRDISTDFFSRNPAITHRLVPWLRRDLGVLFTGEDHVTFMTQYILSLLPNVHLQTEEFHEQLRPFLYGQTEHFIHELVSFARSPYDMNTYDRIAQYDFTSTQQTNQTTSQLPQFGPQGSSDIDVISVSSEDEVIEVPTLSSLLRSDSTSSNTSRAASEQVEALDLSSTHNPEPPSILPDPDQPGPSGFFSNPPVDVKTEPTSFPSLITDDDSEIEIVEVLKPYEERTPEFVIVVSSSTEEEHTDVRRTKQGGKRHQKKKHIQDPEGSPDTQGSSKHRSQSVENGHDEETHRHSNKRKHKDRKHHRHRDSAASSKSHSSQSNHAVKHQERSSHLHERKSRSKSKSLHTFREVDGDRSREQNNSRKDSSSSSHSRGSSKHKYVNRNSQEASGVGRGSHHEETLSADTRECWELLWRNRSQKNAVSEYGNCFEHPSRREAVREEHTHSHHHDPAISRKHKTSGSENGRERTKSRRADDSKHSLLPLTMVISRKKKTLADRYERSDSSTDVLSVSSSHSRHKHKKHKKHKRHKSKEDRKQLHSVTEQRLSTDRVYVQEDTANDGDESSTSTEEDFGSRQPFFI